MKLRDLMEPEETIGNIWHDMASGLGVPVQHPEAACSLQDIRVSLSVLFRALGGAPGVECVAAPATRTRHQRNLRQRIASERDLEWVASFDGERLSLPPVIAVFAQPRLNRDVYFWLAAMAAVTPAGFSDLPAAGSRDNDIAQIVTNSQSAATVAAVCPGLRDSFQRMTNACAGLIPDAATLPAEGRAYVPFAPVPFWLRFLVPGSGGAAAQDQVETPGPAPVAATSNRKLGERKDQDETRRKDSFIIHRFESILSWVESMNINRSVDDNDTKNAQKAADDQDVISLSKHHRRAATRLRLHLDLSPADADHEALAGSFTYPEWNHRARSYMADHCRVLDAPVRPESDAVFTPNARQIRAVRRQFEALRPRRIIQSRQIDGAELDLDALITAKANLAATGQGSDRIWQNARQIERDLSVAFLIDTSRSTEAAIGDTSVIEVAREAMAALAVGIDVAGDRLGIWGFSSLRRDRVFVRCCKRFADPMGPDVTANIGALRPGHYTRLGAAIRHVSAQLAQEPSSRKLLIVLTDGKPNDLDHYEGQYGIEDSHMAVKEARRVGQSLHGIIIDEDGQDWFARIFGRGGFSLLPSPQRLTRALPDIYRSLTQET